MYPIERGQYWPTHPFFRSSAFFNFISPLNLSCGLYVVVYDFMIDLFIVFKVLAVVICAIQFLRMHSTVH